MSVDFTLITGASSGIGKSFAEQLAAKKKNLILIARREERLNELAIELKKKHQIEVTVYPMDLLETSINRSKFDQIFQDHTVTELYNNAGVGHYAPFIETKLTDQLTTINLNITALTELTHIAVKHMTSHGRESRIINIASMASFISMANFSVYCGTKHFVRSFTEALSIEFKNSNIGFTCISPGGVATEFLEHAGQNVQSDSSFVLMDPNVLVRKSLRAIEQGKLHYTPGAHNRFVLILMKFLPKQLGNKIATLGMQRSAKSNYK